MAEPSADPGVTHDKFFGGRLKLTQSARGHRSGTDAVLLAAAVPRTLSGLVYDAGAGTGAVGLGIALMCPAATVRLIEKDAAICRLAADNVASNGLASRAKAIACDLLCKEARRRCLPDSAALVVTNPPFYTEGQVRRSPDAGRGSAHVLDAGFDLADWLSACLDLLAVKGTLIVLHTAAAFPGLLRALDGRAGGITAMAIYPRVGASARRCLVRAVKGSRAPFTMAAPFVLHHGEKLTPEADAIHRGETSLCW